MRIAVCDDQVQALEEIKQMLQDMPNVEIVHLYSDMEIFFSILKEKEYYDVVFMDIDWKDKKTGLDFAEQAQKVSPYTQIVYITAYTMDYVEDIFLRQSNLSGFLMKPIKREQLERNLQKVRDKQKHDEKGKILLHYKGKELVIPFRDITYMESQLHKVKVCLIEQEYLCNEKLVNLKERLNACFLVCHKSFVVNMDYISEFQKREIILKGGKRIPISKARYNEAKSKFFTYMSGKI